jgi:gliding motility-associatede transport system auxiliary component
MLTAIESSDLAIRRQKRRFYLSSLITATAVAAIGIFATLIAYRLPWTYDMTASKVFTLSEQTRQVLASLTSPVEIIAIYPRDGADPMISSLLAEYVKAGPEVEVQYVDAEREPTRLAQYNFGLPAVSNGTVIVRSRDRIKLLYAADMFPVSVDGTAFMGEAQITGAIRYVTAKEMPVVYFVEGHDEASTSGPLAAARTALELNVYGVQTLNLLKAGAVPGDAALLIVASPRKDLSADEFKALDDYMLKGGKALFLVDAMSTNTMVLEKFNNLLHEFGIDITNNLVVEEDSNSHVGNNNLYLIPGYAQHSITEKLAESQRYTVLPIAMGLHTLDYDQSQVKLEPLLATTPRSWMREDMNITSPSRTETDLPGPLPVAYAATRTGSGYGNGDAQVVVVGNSTFINADNIDAYANRDFFLSCVNWLVGGHGEQGISPRIINADRLIVRGTEFVMLLALSVVILPLLPFAGAFVTWYTRRNR